MKLEQYKLILFSIGLICALLIASPAILGLTSSPQGEHFSELYLLGYKHMAQDYPYNIVPDKNYTYTIYYDVVNHVGSSAYYLVYAKFLNASDALPDIHSGTVSPAQILYQKRILLSDGYAYEGRFNFSISNTVRDSNNQTTIGNLRILGQDISLNKAAVWNSTTSENQYKLLFELYIYNSQSHTAEFNRRFVYLQLNCSSKV